MIILIITILTAFIIHNIYSEFQINIGNFKTSVIKATETISYDNDLSYSNIEHLNTIAHELVNKKIYLHQTKTYNKLLKKYINYLYKYHTLKSFKKIIQEKENTIGNMSIVYNNTKKEFKLLSAKYPIEMKKYLIHFNTTESYYKTNYIDNILAMYDILSQNIELNLIEESIKNIDTINTYIKAYYMEMYSIQYLKKDILEAEKNISDYLAEIDNTKGTLYMKLNKKIKRCKDTEVISLWSDIKKQITKYNKLETNDIIIKSNELMEIIVNLKKIDILTLENV